MVLPMYVIPQQADAEQSTVQIAHCRTNRHIATPCASVGDHAERSRYMFTCTGLERSYG